MPRKWSIPGFRNLIGILLNVSDKKSRDFFLISGFSVGIFFREIILQEPRIWDPGKSHSKATSGVTLRCPLIYGLFDGDYDRDKKPDFQSSSEISSLNFVEFGIRARQKSTSEFKFYIEFQVWYRVIISEIGGLKQVLIAAEFLMSPCKKGSRYCSIQFYVENDVLDVSAWVIFALQLRCFLYLMNAYFEVCL